MIKDWLKPHRIVLIGIALAMVTAIATQMRWDWLPNYYGDLLSGVGVTLIILFASCILGISFAIPLGLFQVTGPAPLAVASKVFCTLIRGTPLLLQLWLIYYGVGSLFPQIPWIRESILWPYLREAWPYGVFALTMSFAGYEGEIMRGAFAGVPAGELEAAKAYGMSRWTILRRIWLPRALHRVLPTLAGEVVLQLKSTPLVATITVVDVYAVISKIRQETYIVYEPMLLLALIYLCLTGILVSTFTYFENKIPTRDA
ncbi:MAG: ABC transporter permease subunit [Desulfobacterales bacterium]|nr:ABC transporter permease subunit [Desulfobacterales bacterium]